MELTAAVQAVVAEQLERDASSIPLDQPFIDLGADELDLVAILFTLEEHFVVCISDKQITDAITLRNLTTLVISTVAARRDDELLRIPE